MQEWSVQGTNLIVFIILARLLDASAFGLVALCAVLVSFVKSIVDQGLSTAIVQRLDLQAEHLDSVFWMGLVLAFLFMALTIALAGPVSSFFDEPALARVIRAASPIFVLDALGTVHQAMLRRQFAFRALALRAGVSVAAGGVIGIVLAMRGWGVMSLIAQQVATSFTGMVLLWYAEKWRPQLKFSWSRARELIPFGYNIIGIRMVTFATRRADDVLIGAVLGAVALGYYTVAYKIFKVILDVVAAVVARVALPAFAALQSDLMLFRRGLGKSIYMVAIVAFPVFTGLALISSDVVPLLFGAEWSASAPVTQVLAIAGLCQALLLIFQQAFIGMGRPNWAFRVLLAMAITMIGVFAAVAENGITAVAWGFAAVGAFFLPIQVALLRRAVGFGLRDLAGACRGPMLATAVMSVVVMAWQRIASTLPAETAVAAAIILGALTYAGTLMAINRNVLNDLRARAAA
jgi:O-antigen/teichoic acid export membrane protein